MKRPFESLSSRGQLHRLRRLAVAALEQYALAEPGLTSIQHEHNTTFRVTTANGQRYMLRIHRPGMHTPGAIRSELLWLDALRQETDLRAPEPVPTRDGDLLTLVAVDGVPEPRACVVFRWLDGRFLGRGLRPVHLQQVGEFTGRLHHFTSNWRFPPEFERGSVDVLTAEARRISLPARSAGRSDSGVYPSEEDANRCIDLVSSLCTARDGRNIELTIERIRAALHELGSGSEVFGLVHADLHQENYLFHSGEVRAIDFDDCGWGHHLFDLAVSLSEVRRFPYFRELRMALLAGYRSVRPLSLEHENYLDSFFALRQLQLLMWVLESREHPTFRDNWAAWAREDLRELERFLAKR